MTSRKEKGLQLFQFRSRYARTPSGYPRRFSRRYFDDLCLFADRESICYGWRPPIGILPPRTPLFSDGKFNPCVLPRRNCLKYAPIPWNTRTLPRTSVVRIVTIIFNLRWNRDVRKEKKTSNTLALLNLDGLFWFQRLF